MPRAEIEAALRRDPSDEQAWAVFGDLLAQAGDSRGELIALEQRAQVSERPFERSLLEHQAGELFEREHRRWLGPLAEHGLELVWQRGFVREVVIARMHASVLDRLLALPAAALLRRLVLVGPRSVKRVVEVLASHPDRPIESLVLRRLGEPAAGPALAKLETLVDLGIEGSSTDWVASLAKLPRLRTLALRRCVGPLTGFGAGFAALRSLEISAHGRVEELGPDVLAPLAGLSELRELDLGDAGWTDASPLAALTQLERLDLRSTEILGLAPLASLSALRELNCSGCTGLANLEPLAALHQLERLRLGYTRVRDLRPLAKLERLATLELAGTSVGDLSPLFELPSLRKLDLKACEVADVGPLLRRGVAVHGVRPPERSWREVAEDHLRER